jgi:hypothetical protein
MSHRTTLKITYGADYCPEGFHFVNLQLRRLFYRPGSPGRKVRAIQGAMLPNWKAGESLQQGNRK